jgi:hypothetical protein
MTTVLVDNYAPRFEQHVHVKKALGEELPSPLQELYVQYGVFKYHELLYSNWGRTYLSNPRHETHSRQMIINGYVGGYIRVRKELVPFIPSYWRRIDENGDIINPRIQSTDRRL